MTESSDYLDSWDPLTDDYNDKNSNSYVTGAGANLPSHMQPANYRKDHGNSYVLWVRPLSSRYTEESLKNIFSNYGEVTDVSIIQPKFGDRSSFGYVVYKSQASANDAIRRFNDDPKFDFKVNYAKDESVQKLFQKLERKKSQSQNHRDYSNHVDNNKSFRQGNSQHRRSNYYDKVDDSYSDDRSTRNSRSHQSTRDSVRSNSPLPEKTDRSIISFAFSQDLFPSEKKSRDIQPVEINGFDSKSAVETSIMKPSVVYQTLPQCSSCQKKTFMKCSCCGQNFCNQECSMNGWRHHTGNCIQVAALQHEDSTKAVTVSLNNTVSAPLPSQPHFMNDKDFANLAKDYTASSKIYEDPSILQASTRVNRVDNNYDDNVDGVGYGSRRNDVPKPESRQIRLENGEYESSAKRGEANIGFDRKKPVKRDNDEEDRQRRAGGDSNKSYPVNTNHGKNNAQSRIDRNRMIGGYKRTDDESFTPQANSSAIDDVDVNPFLTSRYRLSLGKMAKVIVLSSVQKEESQGYVRFVDEDDTYKAFHKLLNDYKSFQPHHEDSRKCLARYKNSWCRGFVVGTKSPLRVRLIDEGLYQNFASEDLREVPTPFAQVVPFSHFVQYVNVELSQLQSWAVANEVITIKPIKEENKVWMVEVIPEEPLHEQLEKARKIRDQVSSESVERVPRKKEASPKKPTTPATSVSVPQKPKKNERVLAAGVPISVFVSYVKDDRVFFVAKGEDLLDVNLRLEKEDESKLPPLTEIEPGTMCIGIFCGLCCRAKVLSKDPLRVLYIDYGNEEIAQPGDLKVLPASYENIPPLAIRVKLLEGTVTDGKVIENSEVLITPIKEEKDVPNSWIVCVGDKSSEYKELLSRIESTESVASKSPKSAATAPTVRNTPPKEPVPPVVMDACVTYAVSKSEYYCIKKADVGLFESTITQMTNFTEKAKTVEKGKVYANLFDGLWCRAQVVDTEPLTIYFIDYGNTEICTKDDLYELPEKLQHNPPPLAFRVSLKNESQELLDYGRFMNLLWDVKADSYTLLRDPSATLDDNTAASGAVSSK